MSSEIDTKSRWKELAEIVGQGNVTFDSGPISRSGWEGPLPKAIVSASTAEQVCEVMRVARAERWKVAPTGNGTKQGMAGIPRDIDLLLSMRRLNRVLDYQPADLTITVEAGLRVEDLAATLQAKGQMLPIDAPFQGEATVGGVVVTNSSGPRRLGYGSLRDFVIGVHFVTADGKLVKSGGKVVKNVAGYDMIKILIGSFGTLGVITDVTFRVFPTPPASVTFLFGFNSSSQALQARQRILNSPLTAHAMDLLDPGASTLIQPNGFSVSLHYLVVSAAGPQAVVERVRRDLPKLVEDDHAVSVSYLSEGNERELWNSIQELTPAVLKRSPEAAVVKASVVLSQIGDVAECARRIASEQKLAVATIARAGTGIVYCYFWTESDRSVESIAAACEALLQQMENLDGRAVVEWCPSAIKDKISLWRPSGDDFAMMQGLKAQLDPEGLLNPGRLFGRI